MDGAKLTQMKHTGEAHQSKIYQKKMAVPQGAQTASDPLKKERPIRTMQRKYRFRLEQLWQRQRGNKNGEHDHQNERELAKSNPVSSPELHKRSSSSDRRAPPTSNLAHEGAGEDAPAGGSETKQRLDTSNKGCGSGNPRVTSMEMDHRFF